MARRQLYGEPSAQRFAEEVHALETQLIEERNEVRLIVRDLEVVLGKGRVPVTRVVVTHDPVLRREGTHIGGPRLDVSARAVEEHDRPFARTDTQHARAPGPDLHVLECVREVGDLLPHRASEDHAASLRAAVTPKPAPQSRRASSGRPPCGTDPPPRAR